MSVEKLCINCKHSKCLGSPDNYTDYYCYRPIVREEYLILGGKKTRDLDAECYKERIWDEGCGKEGKYWEKKCLKK